MDCAYFMPTIIKARRFLGYIRCFFHLQAQPDYPTMIKSMQEQAPSGLY
jgi:hypothetical protein